MKKDTEETNLDLFHDTFTTLDIFISDWTNRSALKYISNKHANNNH